MYKMNFFYQNVGRYNGTGWQDSSVVECLPKDWEVSGSNLCHGILLWRWAHISIMLLKPVKYRAKCTAETNKLKKNNYLSFTGIHLVFLFNAKCPLLSVHFANIRKNNNSKWLFDLKKKLILALHLRYLFQRGTGFLYHPRLTEPLSSR